MTHPFGSHDEIAQIMGVLSKSFEETHKDWATEMKRTVLDYIKTLQAICLTGAGTEPGGVSTSHGTIIHWDQDEFPLIPSSVSWDKVSKENLEAIYQSYITQHYHKCWSLVLFQ